MLDLVVPAPQQGSTLKGRSMKQRRITTASWMLVPIVLAAPALVSGVSLWFDWGPQWPVVSLLLAVASLALALDFRRALRCGAAGAFVGLLTSPLLLLLGSPGWPLFGAWIASAIAVSALVTPLLLTPAGTSGAQQHAQSMAQADAETLEQLAAIQRRRRD